MPATAGDFNACAGGAHGTEVRLTGLGGDFVLTLGP